MRYSLLDLTQTVLSSMDSDEVNSITDTVESMQVVEIIKTVYDDIVSRSDLNIHKTLFNLDASGDNDLPVIMLKPSAIDRIIWVKYNCIPDGATIPEWNEMQYVDAEEFLRRSHSLNTDEANVDSLVYSTDTFSMPIYFKTDEAPSCYTSFEDTKLVFNAFDSEVDTTLQSAKTMCYGTKITEFLREDSFVPDLQPQQFSLLLNEAKSLAWAELKQATHNKAEQAARRNWVNVAKKRQAIPSGTFSSGSHPFDKLPNYGRK